MLPEPALGTFGRGQRRRRPALREPSAPAERSLTHERLPLTSLSEEDTVYKDADIELDFRTDWIAFMRQALTTVGYSNLPTADEDVEIAYFNLLSREIAQRPRRVHLSQGFACPPAHQTGFERLRHKVERGDDLRPHQTKTMQNLDFGDGQLNDWGIHHFHLGEKLETNGKFIERTGPVLFAMFKPDDAYFITIQSHDPAARPWSDISMLEEAERNWPHLVVGLPGVSHRGENPTSTEIERARKAGVTALVTINGKLVVPPGGGVTTKQPKDKRSGSALGAAASRRMDRVHNQIIEWQQLVAQRKSEILAEAGAKGLALTKPVRMRLHVQSDSTALVMTEDASFGFSLGPFP